MLQALQQQQRREAEFGPGDVGYLPPGHNAWIIGNGPCVPIGR
jgi:hypothetical protein